MDGLGHVGVETSCKHPWTLVDEVDLEAALAEVARHLDAERRGADHGDVLTVSRTLSNSIALRMFLM